ncbi:MAG: lytic transglycosylase domain-containing protein [Thermodesulfobacteriota bacterium]|nr:lytic transglycosylase domain-containing protein [Thermodesulfobacteriota bacterium]
MKHQKIIGFVLLISFLAPGCAIDRSSRKESEPQKIIIERESSEKYEALAERVKNLEESISKLRSEIVFLEKHFRNIQARPPLSSYKLPKEVTLCGEKIPLEDRNIWENLDREFIVAMDSHAQILLWMKRARRYFPHIEKRLKELNLPDDLKYVAITESSLRPHAVSSSGAAGVWQFIPSTGEKYGMRRNKTIDERFDFFNATEGALTYLKNLHQEFGNWTLAMAAYNAGENRIRREIEFQKTRNYFYLDLPMETERYVYKIAVAKIILSDPGKYGFYLEDREFYGPLQMERVQIELRQPFPLMEVARATGCYYKEVKEMNLHFPEETIPAGIQFLNLPPGTSERFWIFFNHWRKELEGK